MARRRGSATRTIDTGRAGEALARPGMDTRNWCLQGTITGFKLDDEQGPLADVELLPDGDPETVRLGTCYAGDGFGFYAPLDIGDLVLISFPNGDYDAGGIITGRVWGPAQPPPKTATDNPGDVCLHVKKDKTCRIKVFGSGNVAITAEDGKVLLGDETGTKKVIRNGDKLTASVQMAAWALIVETFVNGVVPLTFTPANNFAGLPDPAPGPSNPGKGDQFGSNTQGSDKVESS